MMVQAQALARELMPQGVHVAHFPIDGGVSSVNPNTGAVTTYGRPDTDVRGLNPDDIAATYLFVHRQPKSTWTFEVQLRPWAENW